MKVAMKRVGIDTEAGGMHGPLFRDGSFEFIPIPDEDGVDERTYGNTVGAKGKKLIEYFRESRQNRMRDISLHFDPEFKTFTYGDPTPNISLHVLEQGDLLVFYCGLQGWGFESKPALYLVGYFDVFRAGKVLDFSSQDLQPLFGGNFHVRHKSILDREVDKLVLVKGSERSRLLTRAVKISDTGRDRADKPIKVLSKEMQSIFGDFGGRLSFQRGPTRWVDPTFATGAAEFMRSLV